MLLYNSLSNKKEPVAVDGTLSLYACGLTVYDSAHIGHLRCMLVFDMFVRFMKSRGVDVTYVRNITDVDDKIIKRANDEGITTESLTQRIIQEIADQERSLGLIKPTHEPKASEYITQMIEMIATLEEKGFAYVADSGDVCFRVSEYKAYGQLSNQKIDTLLKGHRVEGSGKQASEDFVLWKKSKPGEPFWSSPWGEGRPGWHIECSAMACDLLGDTFDIHGGGVDLKFPHHENEIAQARAANGGEFAKHWMHVGHLHVNNEKMSKSLGNFVTIDDAIKQYHAEVLKLFLLKTHYRQPFNYHEEGMEEARSVLLGFYLALQSQKEAELDPNDPDWQAFVDALEDDLNVAKALSVMHSVAGKLQDGKQTSSLYHMGKVFGLFQESPEEFLVAHPEKETIDTLIEKRQTLRQNRDFSGADAVRDQLASMGIVLKDGVDGTSWYNGQAGKNQ